MEIRGRLINSYYGNRRMRGRYNIHALFQENTLTSETKHFLSEGKFTVRSDATPAGVCKGKR
jgi:hypothetical protein